MAKTDWEAAAKLFALENERSGIGAKDWCEQNGLNYQSARRYLKTRGQSPSSKKDSRVQAPNGKSKSSKTAQTAQKPVRKTNAQKQTAQNDECANAQIEPSLEQNSENQSTDEVKYNGRDDAGRFIAGNPGNQNPSYSFPERHQINTKHGGYSRFFDDEPELYDEAKALSIIDEIHFVRARILSTTKALTKIRIDLAESETLQDRVSLYESLVKAEQALDRNIGRVESLTKTLSTLRLDDATEPKIKAETERIRSAKRKLDAESVKLERDQGGDTTPLDEIVDDLQAVGTGGLMS